MAGQKNKTKEYWDTFYSELKSAEDSNRFATEGNHPSSIINNDASDVSANELSDLEWIVPNSPRLLDTILGLFPPPDPSVGLTNRLKEETSSATSVNILEIGCGVSKLSISLLQRQLLNNQEALPDAQTRGYSFVATDVSSVCIEHSRTRDDKLISSFNTDNSSLKYALLDVLAEKPSITIRNYDIILDKGTLDTFLFRSKRTQKGSSSHPPLLAPLLNNIHRWLGCGAKYIIISPRSKIKSVRDFRGFTSVRRIKVDTATLGGEVILVKSNNEKAARSKAKVYLYECIKNDSYNPEKDSTPYRTMEISTADESTCLKCGISFKDFRGNGDVKDQGEVVWARRWKNHYPHCKGKGG